MRLIDADETLMDAEHMSAFRCSLANMEDLNILIGGQETIDAVPVVRCRECKKHSEANGKHYCKFWRMYCPDDSDFYCKAGEWKEGAD